MDNKYYADNISNISRYCKEDGIDDSSHSMGINIIKNNDVDDRNMRN